MPHITANGVGIEYEEFGPNFGTSQTFNLNDFSLACEGSEIGFVLVFPILFACRTLFFNLLFACILGPKKIPETLPKKRQKP